MYVYVLPRIPNGLFAARWVGIVSHCVAWRGVASLWIYGQIGLKCASGTFFFFSIDSIIGTLILYSALLCFALLCSALLYFALLYFACTPPAPIPTSNSHSLTYTHSKHIHTRKTQTLKTT
jgi:hypothetical protein